jgi:hypothetical protein
LGQNEGFLGFLEQRAGLGGQSCSVIPPLSVSLKEAAANRKSPAQTIDELAHERTAAAAV